MRKQHLFVWGCCGFALFTAAAVAAEPSPWDKGQEELTGEAALPVRYPAIFERERETLGYCPRFMPGMLSFTSDGRPVMRVGLERKADAGLNRHRVKPRSYGKLNWIQYLDRDGKWRVTDGHVQAVRKYLQLRPDDPLRVLYGERTPDAVEFDAQGGAHTLVSVEYTRDGKKRQEWFLVYSPDEFQTFAVNRLADVIAARLEPHRVHAARDKTPWILALIRGNRNQYSLIRSYFREKDGKLVVSRPMVLVPDMGARPESALSTMAGDGAQMVTAGGKTFCVFALLKALPGMPGTPQYVVEYDHASGKVSEPLLLGTTGHRVDGHNVPVIDIDSRGFLHVVGGSHWHSFKHWTSKKPFSTLNGWTDPEPIGAKLDNLWSRDGLSYPGMLIDRKDTIHVVARGRNRLICDRDQDDPHDAKFTPDELNYALVYLRKKAGGDWEKRVDLAIPAWPHYSNWYHKVAIDGKDRIYCTYYYYASWLAQVPGAAEEYRKRWPEDIAADGTLPGSNLSAHDPVLIGSDDGGDHWRLIRTADFR